MYNIGDKVGSVTIYERALDHIQPSGCRMRQYWVQCDCGHFELVRGYQLNFRGQKIHCKHCNGKVHHTPEEIVYRDMIKRGDKFKHLEVLGPVSERKSYPSGVQHNQYLCRCDCGNLTVVTGSNLKNGNTSSCGCHQMSELGVKHRKPKYTVLGVCPVQQEERVKYSARLQVSGEMLELGTYYTEEEAIIHRLYAEKKHLGYDAPQKHLFAQYGIV